MNRITVLQGDVARLEVEAAENISGQSLFLLSLAARIAFR